MLLGGCQEGTTGGAKHCFGVVLERCSDTQSFMPW